MEEELGEYYLSDMWMSMVREPAPFMIDLQAYTYHLECQLLGKPCELPPGAENFVGVHMMVVIGPEELEMLQEGELDLTDLIEGFEDEDNI